MTTVTTKPGYYLVRTVDADGVRTHLVDKDKHCSCGGNARRRCTHIRAVAQYLEDGGERAPAGTAEYVHDNQPVKTNGACPDTCPICEGEVQKLGPSFWRCVDDSSHHWQWRSEQNGGAIKKFLTRPHPVKRGAFYAMTEQERQAFLLRAAQRMHQGGYTPHNGKEHHR